MSSLKATLKTNRGDIFLDLFPNHAPTTVENFTGLAEGTKDYRDDAGRSGEPFYDGLGFHRTAAVLASRQLEIPEGAVRADRSSYKGLSLRVVYAYDHGKKKDLVSVDMLYGIKATRPEGVVQLNWGQGS